MPKQLLLDLDFNLYVNMQLDLMHRPFQWKIQLLQLSGRRQYWLQYQRIKFWHLLIVLFLILLLWKMLNQLSTWNGIVSPIFMDHEFPDNDELGEYSKHWLEFGYNAWLAKRLPLFRNHPDMRDDRCLNEIYSCLKAYMSEVCIIVIFRNEQLSMLLRTLHSIRDATNEDFFGELLLIDDNSDTHFWQQELSRKAFKAYVETYVHAAPRIFHLEEKVGVVRARRFAAAESKAETLVFLDAHVEVTEGWLEPLLATICANRKTLAVPQLDRLDEETLEYVQVVERRGLFDWSLRRREVPLMWQQLKKMPQPFATAVARTSVFAINARWFDHLSKFDMEINAPAAAELELNFKVWRSKGQVLHVPCSRVGHLQPSDRNYMQRYGNFNQMAVKHFKSFKRLTELWLSEPMYKSQVYEYQPQIQQATIDNVSELQQFIKTPNFESFDWYLQHVATDLLLNFPLTPRTDHAYGTLSPAELPSHCLTGDLSTRRITLKPCTPQQRAAQHWTLTYMNDLRLGDGNICAEVQRTQSVALNRCHTFGGRQSWRFDETYNCLVSNKHCLELTVQLKVIARPCHSMNTNQMWFFEHTKSRQFT